MYSFVANQKGPYFSASTSPTWILMEAMDEEDPILQELEGLEVELDQCIQNVLKEFFPIEYYSLDQIPEIFDKHLASVQAVLNKMQDLNPQDRAFAASNFKRTVLAYVEEEWIEDAIGYFYPILKVSDHLPRMIQLQGWSKQFISGIHFFHSYKDNAASFEVYACRFIQKANDEFLDYCKEKIDEENMTMVKLYNENPHLLFTEHDFLVDSSEEESDASSNQSSTKENQLSFDQMGEMFCKCLWMGLYIDQNKEKNLSWEEVDPYFSNLFTFERKLQNSISPS